MLPQGLIGKGELVFDGTPERLFATGNLAAWNLDQPDLLVLAKTLEQTYQVAFDHQPRTVEDLFKMVKEVLR